MPLGDHQLNLHVMTLLRRRGGPRLDRLRQDVRQHRPIQHGCDADIFKVINDDKGFAEDLRARYGREVYLTLRDQ